MVPLQKLRVLQVHLRWAAFLPLSSTVEFFFHFLDFLHVLALINLVQGAIDLQRFAA